MAFADYGITAPDLQYDDYVGLDVRGKIVLVLTGEPARPTPRAPSAGPTSSTIRSGATRSSAPRAVLAILVAAVTRATGDALLGPAARRLAEVADGIDRALAPQSFAIAGVTVTLEISLVRDRGTTANVVGILGGTDPKLRDEAVVIGGHYDHLSHGDEGPLAPDKDPHDERRTSSTPKPPAGQRRFAPSMILRSV